MQLVRPSGIWISCIQIWGWLMGLLRMLCIVSVIRSCLMLGRFGVGLYVDENGNTVRVEHRGHAR
jgi:hypothetical protein